jgi:hypothetical protein
VFNLFSAISGKFSTMASLPRNVILEGVPKIGQSATFHSDATLVAVDDSKDVWASPGLE